VNFPKVALNRRDGVRERGAYPMGGWRGAVCAGQQGQVGEGVFSCADGPLSSHYPRSGLSRGRVPHHTPAVTNLFGLPVFCCLVFLPPFSTCYDMSSGGCAAGVEAAAEQEGGGGDAPGCQQREFGGGNWHPGAGRKGKESGGRQEGERDYFLKILFPAWVAGRARLAMRRGQQGYGVQNRADRPAGMSQPWDYRLP